MTVVADAGLANPAVLVRVLARVLPQLKLCAIRRTGRNQTLRMLESAGLSCVFLMCTGSYLGYQSR